VLTAIKYTPLAVPKLTDDTEGGAARGNHTQPTVPELANDTAEPPEVGEAVAVVKKDSTVARGRKEAKSTLTRRSEPN